MDADRIVVMGVAAAGKSSVGRALAAQLGARFVDADELHPPSNIAKMAGGTPLTDADRAPWLDLVGAELAGATPVVVACSALRRTYRDRLRAGAGHPVWFIHLAAPQTLLATRIGTRTDHFMPATLLDDQYATLEPLTDEEDGVVVDVTPAIPAVVDAAARSLRA